MKLSKKTYIYTFIFACVITIFFIFYMIFLLPSLYLNHMNERNIKNVEDIQYNYSKDKSYENVIVHNITSTISFIIPKEDYNIKFNGKFLNGSIFIKDNEIKEIIEKMKEYIENNGESTFDGDFSKFLELFKSIINIDENDFLDFKIKFDTEGWKEIFKEEKPDVKVISNNEVIISFEMGEREGLYTTYMGVKNEDKEIYITFMSVLSPSLNEIIPVTLSSIPMIVATIFLIVFISSFIFSKKIVDPIIDLSSHAIYLRNNSGQEITRYKKAGKDEISQLGEILDNLYIELVKNNKKLEVENKRQEIFIRSSSHQLKTPVAAAKLLIDGIINEVGRYKDTKTYLPELRNKIINIENIIRELLHLNKVTENVFKEAVAIKLVVQEVVKIYNVYIKEKELKVNIYGGEGLIIDTDRQIFKKIIDNIISNAVEYSPVNEKIDIEINKKNIKIKNSGVTIDKELIPYVFEAFVTSKNNKEGNGLGLYLVAYYTNILEYEIDIKNEDNGVVVSLEIEKGIE